MDSNSILATITSVILIAFILFIGVSVFSSLHTTAKTADIYELGVTSNETIPLADNRTDYYPLKADSQTLYINATGMTEGTDYTINDQTGEITYIRVPALTTADTIKAVYTYYGGTAFDSLNRVANQTYSGFKIGAMIPYVMFAVAIIVVLIGAFSFARRD